MTKLAESKLANLIIQAKQGKRISDMLPIERQSCQTDALSMLNPGALTDALIQLDLQLTERGPLCADLREDLSQDLKEISSILQ
ncbi:MAG: hypothetical protein IPM37_18225 [Hahellaceae bacterium]|nr:hypothetical protein [Hahellaceae bacterium]